MKMLYSGDEASDQVGLVNRLADCGFYVVAQRGWGTEPSCGTHDPETLLRALGNLARVSQTSA
jgi:hypothetical protein